MANTEHEISSNNFEHVLSQRMFNSNSEKSFMDKLFSKEDALRIRQLMRKDPLAREDLLELLNLLGGVEAKLVNLSEWDRYVSLKFFVWVREFIKINMFLFDYEQSLARNPGKKRSHTVDLFLENNKRLMEHNTKFLIDLYLALNRTTLSLGGTGFLESLKTKFELAYAQPQGVHQPEQKGILSGFFKSSK